MNQERAKTIAVLMILAPVAPALLLQSVPILAGAVGFVPAYLWAQYHAETDDAPDSSSGGEQ